MGKFVCVFLYVGLGTASCAAIHDQNYAFAAAYAFGALFSFGMLMVEEVRRP